MFQSGFAANAGTVAAILGREDVIVSDELNHASIIDGARLSRAEIKVFPHRDAAAARQILQDLPAERRKLLITDGVFSMDGDLGALPELCALAEEFGCIMMVDDAHASGVFGANGRGTIDHFGLHGRVDIQVGTLSKAIGALGGYVAGSRALIEFLYHRARPFLFSTSHPPAVAAACIAAIDVLLEEPELIDRLWENTRFFKAGLKQLGFNTGASESPITPVIAGDGALAMKLSDRLFEEGVFAQGIAFPTVAARQGARPNDRDSDAYEGRAAVRARCVHDESAANWALSEVVSYKDGVRTQLLRHVRARSDVPKTSSASSRGTRATHTSTSPGGSTPRRCARCRGTGGGLGTSGSFSSRSAFASRRRAARCSPSPSSWPSSACSASLAAFHRAPRPSS